MGSILYCLYRSSFLFLSHLVTPCIVLITFMYVAVICFHSLFCQSPAFTSKDKKVWWMIWLAFFGTFLSFSRHPKVRLDRQRYPEDPGFTRAFTAAELNIGIRVLKNGKAPGLDDIQTELIKQFRPKARDWLLRFFNNCTETKKSPKIWRQAKVVALYMYTAPIRCDELPTDLPALPHLQAVRTTHIPRLHWHF